LIATWCGEAALERFARNAIEASFASPERKASLHAELEEATSPEMPAR
jgi:adenosine deaminase